MYYLKTRIISITVNYNGLLIHVGNMTVDKLQKLGKYLATFINDYHFN